MEKIELVLGKEEDVTIIHELQYKAFLPLYEKYHDDETNPVKEKISRTKEKVIDNNSDFYLIKLNGTSIGGVCVARKRDEKKTNQVEYIDDINYISPIFLLSQYTNKGIGQMVINQLFEKYPDTIRWILYTIKQEKGNCHLYEKCGFVQVGNEKVVNDKMTLIKYEKSTIKARRFEEKDAVIVKKIICRNFLEVNIKDYGKDVMEQLAKIYNEEKICEIAGYAHMYVFEYKGIIVGCGAISSYWGSLTESILLTIFVLPELQGKGIGTKIIQTLEDDEIFIRANRIEIPASITAVKFYKKFGYIYKNNKNELDEEGHYRLEKYREIEVR